MREEKTVVQVEPEKVQDAVSYAVGSNSIEGLILTEEELKKIHADVQAGKGEKSFLMAVLQYVQQKKKERDLHIKEGMSHGAHRK
jgi:hypothetical protein